MTISAQIVADSVNPSGNRLTTWLLRYPRCIHAEVMTHRVFSRNSASSRAIPIERMIQNITDDPFIPEWWGKAQPGMQAFEEIGDTPFARRDWLDAMHDAIKHARDLARYGLHKQVINRLLEPWMHIEVVLSATEFNNFFLLRRDEMAEPHIRHLANDMWELYHSNEPRQASATTLCSHSWKDGYYDLLTRTGAYDKLDASKSIVTDAWHLPFLDLKWELDEEAGWLVNRPLLDAIKESVAHNAWVSYGNLEGKRYTQDDVNRVYDRLLGSQPIHSSPAEHVAVACNGPHRHQNIVGWCSWRSFLPGQSGGDYLTEKR